MYKGTNTPKAILLSKIAFQNFIPLRNLEKSRYVDMLTVEKK